MAPKTASTQKPDLPRIEGVWLGAALALLGAFLILPSIRGMDGAGNYVYAMSILNDGDLDFTNDYAAIDFQGRNDFRLSEECPRDPATGLPANRYGVGSAIFWAPAVVAVHALLRAAAPERADGLTRPYEWAVAISSAFWGCLGVWLLYNRLREGLGRLASATAAAGILLATPLGFYIWAHGSMSHAVSFFLAVAAMLSLEKAVRAPTRLAPAALGLWTGLLVAARPQDATWAVTLGGSLFWLWGGAIVWRRAPAATGRGEPNPAPVPFNRFLAFAVFMLAAALAFFPQMAAWKILYGSWLSGPAPYLNREAGGFEPLPVHLFEVLIGRRRGLFLWHPILLLGLAGIVAASVGRLSRADVPTRGMHTSALESRPTPLAPLFGKNIAVVAIIGLALQLYLVSCWSVWWAGASFGNRFFISSYPWLALGLGSALGAMERRVSRWAGPALVAALIAWNGGLLVQYGAEMISREETNSWIEIVANQFTEVPAWVIERISSRL